MIDQIRIYGILKISPSVVGKEYVNSLTARIRFVLCRHYRMVDGVYDIGMWREECVSFHFFEGKGDRFLAKGAADLFQSV